MTNHINLMTTRARVKECSRMRVKQWSRILVAVFALLAVHASISWWPIHSSSQRRELMETQYNPLRQMKAANKKLAAQIAGTLDQSKLELALSRQTPVHALVGLVSQKIAESNGEVFLEQIGYSQREKTDVSTASTRSQLALEGFSSDPIAVQRMAESLRSALPFAEVTLHPIESIEINEYPMQTFQIECSF